MPRHPQGHVFYRNMGRDYPIIERGEGVYLFDTEGRRYLDASGGPLVVNIGHGVKPVAEAMAEQAGAVAYVHGGRFTTAALESYSHRLAEHTPLPHPRFFFLTSGPEAVEAAIKFARQVQAARGQPERTLIISRWGSYHGATLGTLAVSGKPAMRNLYGSMFRDMPHIEPPYCYRCPFGQSYPACGLTCAHQLEREIVRQGAHRVAAFLAEPVGGATLGGVVPPAEYWPLVRDICTRHGVLLIADEVLTGMGRTGAWFACTQLGFEPDVMAMGKGVAGGYVPISALAVKGEDVETLRQAMGNFNHGGTFSHHAVGAAAALAVMDVLEGESLVERAAQMARILRDKLRAMQQRLPCVGDVRGTGLMWGVEFVADRAAKTPFPADAHLSDRISARCMELGVLVYPGHGGVDGVRGDHLMVAPPFIVTEAQLDTIVEALEQAIRETCPD